MLRILFKFSLIGMIVLSLRGTAAETSVKMSQTGNQQAENGPTDQKKSDSSVSLADPATNSLKSRNNDNSQSPSPQQVQTVHKPKFPEKSKVNRQITSGTKSIAPDQKSQSKAVPDSKVERPLASRSSHSHGVAQIDVISSEAELKITGEIPLIDLVGFEKMPRSAEEKSALSHIFNSLRKGAIVEPMASDCVMSNIVANVEPPFGSTDALKIGVDQPNLQKQPHHNINFDASWKCKEQVAKLKLGVFEGYYRVNEVNVKYSKQGKQGTMRVKRSDKREVDLY